MNGREDKKYLEWENLVLLVGIAVIGRSIVLKWTDGTQGEIHFYLRKWLKHPRC